MERLHRLGTLEKVRRDSVAETEVVYQKTIASPVGPLTLIASDSALVALQWGCASESDSRCVENSVLGDAEKQLTEYFLAKRRAFDLPLAPKGTEFQKRAWEELLKIPYGTFTTYGEQATRLGKPNAARAVGAANGKNPIGIIVPCHRVIGASGSLTGFAGGIEVKRKLLALEGVRVKSRA